ncbi:MAG: 50S ribosomal protein L29 [Chloroflexota bacterium]
MSKRGTALRAKTPSELLQVLRETEDELATLRFQLANRQATNQARSVTLKREIARVKTLLREDQLRRMG